MFSKRYIIALILVIVVIGTVTQVSVAKETEKIGGINFNIPEGFEKVHSGAGSEDINGIHYAVNNHTFENDDGDVIDISVKKPTGSTSQLNIPSGASEKTINGVKGYSTTLDGLPAFMYIQDGKVVSISASKASLIDEVLGQ